MAYGVSTLLAHHPLRSLGTRTGTDPLAWNLVDASAWKGARTMVGRLKSTLRPSRTEAQFLLAALGPPESAPAAWQSFAGEADLVSAPVELQRLAPLLRPRMEELGLGEADRRYVDVTSKMAWVHNQQLLQAGGNLVRSLEAEETATLVLKGAALLAAGYASVAERRMADVDLLVPYERREAAVESLTRAGWRLTKPPDFRSDKHGISLTKDPDLEVDLHWHVSTDFVRFGSETTTDDDFWSAARGARIGDAETLVLNPADQLLHLIVHGHKRGEGTRLQWVADATTLIASEEICWSRLVEQADIRGSALIVADALALLDELLGIGPPASVLTELRTLRSPPQMRLARWLDSRPPSYVRPVKVGRRALGQYLYLTADRSIPAAIGTLPSVLQDRWDVEGPRYVLGQIGSRSRVLLRQRR